jgi:hypothetical protein
MKRNKIYTYLIPAIAAAVVGWAYAADDATPALEKVKLPQRVAKANTARARVSYPKMALTGAADGIPYGLRTLEIDDRAVTLSWISPEAVEGYFDDFESHEDFAINSPGNIGWSYLDADNRDTYTWAYCTFPNQGSKMAFIVMNPAKTTPATIENPNYVPYSGTKMLVDFCSIDAANNDYLISPELNFGTAFKVSFQARSYKIEDNFAAERVRVGYSTTGKSPSDFTFVTEEPYITLPAAWTLIEATIPAEAKYVCINCVSDDAFMFMLDDLYIGTNAVRPNAPAQRKGVAAASTAGALLGFNIYRDGVKVNDEPVSEVRYTDTVDEYRTFSYTVTALYADGTESAPSEALEVEVPDVHLLPFEDDFIKWQLASDKWSTPGDANGENRWKVDYYTYGLVDPAATYSYSALTDYDQSLVTTELHTIDQASTYLRFELKLQQYRYNTTDYLSVELTNDGGETWQEIHTFDNTNGAFDWTVFQYPLADLLTSNAFQIRFRAHGSSAFYIDYWYVDDVKVWNPVWTSAQLSVATSEGALAGCPVLLTADHGAVIRDTTDAQGIINMSKIEVGRYAVSITEDNYNVLTDSLDVTADGNNTFALHVSHPVLHTSAESITADMAVEEQTSRTVTLRNDGDGAMTWRLRSSLSQESGDASDLWQVQRSFDASGDLQSSIVFDGAYYYTTSTYQLGCFWKYDAEGNFIEQFSIPEMYYMMYDLTFDGRYFYGSDYANRLFQLDFDNRRIVRIIDIDDQPSMTITHCTYDPNRDGFWVGSWNSIVFVDRNGVSQSLLTNISTTTSLSIFGSAYDDVTPGGPYLWLSNEETANENTLDQIQLLQYSLNTRSLTGVSHVVSDLPGYKVGTSYSSVNNICGLYSSVDVEDGSLSLLGILSQSPAYIFAYKICATDSWLSYEPKMGTLQPGEEQEITLHFDARNGVVGEEYTTQLSLLTLPEQEAKSLTVGYRAVKGSATPRPVRLTAEADTALVRLSWGAGSAQTQPTGYRIYRDETLVTELSAADTAYTDAHLLRGTYNYTVTALYGEAGESVASDAAEVTVKVGAPYYAPLDLQSAISGNRYVRLDWQAPTINLGDSATLTWSSGEHADELGLIDGGFFYFGEEWSADDLVPYRGKQVTSISARLVNQVLYVVALVYKDGVRIRQQALSGSVHYGEYNEVTLSNPVTIEPGSDYRFVMMVMHSANINPVALDGSSAVNGKGNLMSTDGKEWFTSLEAGIDGNFNMSISLCPDPNGVTEEAPTAYNIYRDGERVNTAPVRSLSFSDQVTVPGLHEYRVASLYADQFESALSAAASVRVLDIAQRCAPRTLNAQIERNRIVTLRWDYPTAEALPLDVDITSRPCSGSVDGPEMVRAFDGRTTEMGIATDGNSIYTTIYEEDGAGSINRYTMAGQFVENFTIDDLESIRNLTYDGTSFYAADNQTNIYRLDMEHHTVAETIAISEYARHLCYVPTLNGGKGGFEVGDWETSIYITTGGAKIGTGPSYLGAAGTAYYDGKLYAFEQGGATTHDLAIYDMTTLQRIGVVDLSQYVELAHLGNASAGGMSTYTTADGQTFLLMCLQNTARDAQFAILDLSGTPGVAGYNVYRDGTQVNDTLLTSRYFTQVCDVEGTYRYQVQTVYIDDVTSDLSDAATVSVVAAGESRTPLYLRAEQSTFGYNVLLSFADPDLERSVASFQGFEALATDSPVELPGVVNRDEAWSVTAATAYDGAQSLTCTATSDAYLIFPVGDNTWCSFVARNADDHEGSGAVDLLYSTGTQELIDMIYFDTYTTTEAWSLCTATLPAGTKYVALRKQAAQPQLYVDAFRLNQGAPATSVYGYDLMRNGVQLNSEPLQDIHYTDHNLEKGRYTYRVRQITTTSGVSEWSDPVTIDLDYDNGGRAPEQLTATMQTDGVLLNWSAPSLGEPIYLRHHSGKSYDAAGLPSGGAFYAGVRWYASELTAYDALSLTDVQVYIHEIPDALFLLVYEGGNLVRQQFVPSLVQYSFNTIHLDSPLAIDVTKELRVVIYVEHNEISTPLGYDEGPAVYGKGDLYSSDGTTWSTLYDDGSIDGNWCISVGLSPFATVADSATTDDTEIVMQNAFAGYNVYCNRELLNERPIRQTTWLDAEPRVSPYLEYQVAAVYTGSGEAYSSKVRLYASDLEAAALAGLKISVAGSAIRIIGAQTGDVVTLATVDGRIISSARVRDTYVYELSTSELLPGIYLLQVADRSLKLWVE